MKPRLFYVVVVVILFLSFDDLMAQVNSKCESKQYESSDRFEHWLHGKQINSQQMAAVIYMVPVVVHVLHHGDPLGQGFNFSAERIINQIRTLNEDYRRKEDTPGFNTNPDGGDTRIEFVLAKRDPNGNPTDGIVRVNIDSVHIEPSKGDIISTCTEFSYWNPDEYLNIWCLSGLQQGLLLGSSRFPLSDLEGLPKDLPDGDGVFINAFNFGSGDINTDPTYNMGRTLTHEIGHFLGLLHTFGPCGQYTDYCEDTPPAGNVTSGCPAIQPIACDGRLVMIENYMDYSSDRCMNTFTNDQIARMRTVLENSPRRKSLLTSPGLGVTGIPDENFSISIYPNPVADKLYIALDDNMVGENIHVSVHSLLGELILDLNFTASMNTIELPASNIQEKAIIVSVVNKKSIVRKLILKR